MARGKYTSKAWDFGEDTGLEYRDNATAMMSGVMSAVQDAKSNLVKTSNSLMETMLGISIAGLCNFNDRNYEYMSRLMAINIEEKAMTLRMTGQFAMDGGDSTAVTTPPERPWYAEGRNYLDFNEDVRSGEPAGDLATRTIVEDGGVHDYTNRNEIYRVTANLYPDELDTELPNAGTDGDAFMNQGIWRVDRNPNSLLAKTKKLFQQHKINTLISRFSTRADGASGPGIDHNGSKTARDFGESHGRNLLTKDAEEKGQAYAYHGYNNPYCRVWTHHHQYDRLDKTIRPFTSVIYDSTDMVSESPETFHGAWADSEDRFKLKNSTKFGWKDRNSGWKHSVIDPDTGMPRITPIFNGGGDNNIHTKDCMFSIENLAWRGYSPYDFERSLSWEQRGPLGGRIMWFPPYGLSFTETTAVNWNQSSFIGRGEDVFTYVNTARSGTLSFLMVVDHPSIIDYSVRPWSTPPEDLHDTDLLRFFAGCADLTEFPVPTPLQPDEYREEYKEPEPTPQPEPEDPAPKPEEKKESTYEPKTIQFYVFYPNNYSGQYDYPTNDNSTVDAISYLLFGTVSQKQNAGMDDMPLKAFTEQIPSEMVWGNGYETSGTGLSQLGSYQTYINSGNFIHGSSIRWPQYWAKGSKTYAKSSARQWFYRIDGEYSVPSKISNTTNPPKGSPYVRNTYDQILLNSNGVVAGSKTNENYFDTQNCKYNSSADAVLGIRNFVEDGMAESLYSLKDFAAAVAHYKHFSAAETKLGFEEKGKSGKVFKALFSEIKVNGASRIPIESVEVQGFSNSHGYNAQSKLNQARNNNLAEQRATTVANWLKKVVGIDASKVSVGNNISGADVESTDKYRNSGDMAKAYRSAKVTITYLSEQTKTVSDTEQEGTDSTTVVNSDNIEGRELSQQNGLAAPTKTDDLADNPIVRKRDEAIGNAYRDGYRLYDTDDWTDMNGMSARTRFYKNRYENEETTNKYRYDQEYMFFKKLEHDAPAVHASLMEKLKYFDPAFHSMTPEGFNGRLTFLNQCTRQGATISMSDGNKQTASNLAFGRPPFCVLRIGDFFNQMIVIESINIDYSVSDGIQWDFNTEGIGMQPMLAQVNIQFKFVGGADINGPVRRLQNAMTFNYYANASLYDNRADRVSYNWDNKAGGAFDYRMKPEFTYYPTMQSTDDKSKAYS